MFREEWRWWGLGLRLVRCRWRFWVWLKVSKLWVSTRRMAWTVYTEWVEACTLLKLTVSLHLKSPVNIKQRLVFLFKHFYFGPKNFLRTVWMYILWFVLICSLFIYDFIYFFTPGFWLTLESTAVYSAVSMFRMIVCDLCHCHSVLRRFASYYFL